VLAVSGFRHGLFIDIVSWEMALDEFLFSVLAHQLDDIWDA